MIPARYDDDDDDDIYIGESTYKGGSAHTHTHTHTYIYIYIYTRKCISTSVALHKFDQIFSLYIIQCISLIYFEI